MALHGITDREQTLLTLLTTEDLRLCRFYAQYMRTLGISYEETLDESDTRTYCLRLNNALKACFPNEDGLFDTVEKIKRAASQEVVPTKEFDWLKKNERACYWLWGTLRTGSEHELSIEGVPKNLSYPPPIPYMQLELNQHPTLHLERFELIVKFIDNWNFGLTSFEGKGDSKLKFLEKWKTEWFSKYAKSTPFKWLDPKNADQCQWACEYMCKACNENREGFPEFDYLSFLNNNPKSFYDALQAAYDVWRAHKDTKKLFLQNMSKAWSQIKYHKNENNVPLNIYIKKELKQKLKLLAELENKNLKDVIEMLIKQEAEQKLSPKYTKVGGTRK